MGARAQGKVETRRGAQKKSWQTLMMKYYHERHSRSRP